jgi:hypothetical protein
VRQQAPVVRTQPAQSASAKAPATAAKSKAVAKPKPKPAAKPKPKPAATRPARVAQPVAAPRAPHDRASVPLVAFVPSAEELDRGLLTAAGLALLLASFGGAVLLAAARRQLEVVS